MSKNEEKIKIENLLNPLNSSANLQNISVELDHDLEKIRKIPLDQAFLNDFLESVSNTPSPTSSPKNYSNSPFNLSNSSLSSTSNFSRSPLSRTSSDTSNLSLNSGTRHN